MKYMICTVATLPFFYGGMTQAMDTNSSKQKIVSTHVEDVQHNPDQGLAFRLYNTTVQIPVLVSVVGEETPLQTNLIILPQEWNEKHVQLNSSLVSWILPFDIRRRFQGENAVTNLLTFKTGELEPTWKNGITYTFTTHNIIVKNNESWLLKYISEHTYMNTEPPHPLFKKLVIIILFGSVCSATYLYMRPSR